MDISDIVGRHKVRNRAELEKILNILSSVIGSLTNPRKLSAAFKSMKQKNISQNTIKNYIDYLCDSFLIDCAVRYDIQSAYAVPDRVKMEQEQRSLMLTGDAFKKIIIMWDAPIPHYNEDGVLVMSICDFLLDENSLEH